MLLAAQTAVTAQETRQTSGAKTTYAASDERSGNPLFEGWYADPEGVVFGDEYWIFPTWSAPYDEQTFLDTLDEMVENAFDDQCTGANPRYPLMSEIKELYLKADYGK